ncbi:MAG: methionyl-tRNA formyltransferase [Desulfobacterales bacterium]|nr:methionyl-tRNA formyltransferase [Desulfobacterales bacterium]
MGKHLNVIFMGTPDFAVPSLKALKESGYAVSLVVTRPDQPRGRGKKNQPPPVKVAAKELNIPVFQTLSVKSDDFYQMIADYRPDLMVVVAFGHIIPKKILEIPAYGAINVHASLLPKYRGPAPIQWAIINGETETGITTMLMDAGLDTGEMLMSFRVDIKSDDTGGTLHDLLSEVGASVLIGTIQKLTDGSLRPIPQNHALSSYAPMLKKEDGRIDWKKPADHIERFIRGMSPWPGAFTFLDGRRMRIFKAKIWDAFARDIPGKVIRGFSSEMCVATGMGILSILEVQMDSGKRLEIREFLKGASIPENAEMS